MEAGKLVTSAFDWSEHVVAIEECAEKNDVLEIDMPKDEWERLRREESEQRELASLKPLLSENAFSRLVLLPFEDEEDTRYYLLVARFGRCPG